MGGISIDDAVRNGRQNVSQLLIDSGSNKPSKHFDSELLNACYSGDIEIVKRLLNNHVNANCRDYDSRTPLHLAVSRYFFLCLHIIDIILKLHHCY
jgi:ankyrin repeat protein